ncbi:histidine kinase [Ornithinimicrobium sp. F0845]|uniref:sensor histidine kinase n=1 Tax=Ornithinimicrobium sp. F0845 TaxID=2926412 RepID=UPI001FF3F7B2|nr:histidine kinase [Ornithinimicrobium sp. F0845]MCK0112852.1 histidine kinase [Ornithinimicrobium sp. F0845]
MPTLASPALVVLLPRSGEQVRATGWEDGDMVTRWTKGLLHLLVGGACAALVAWLVFGFSQTVVHTSGPVQITMAALVLLTLALVGWLLLTPPVRPAEVALARALLDVELPEPVDTTSWGARGRGPVWASAVIVLGGLSLLALLWCLPQGLAMVVLAFSDDSAALLPSGLDDLPPLVLVPLGLLVAAAGLLVQPLLVVLLRRLARPMLGPTAQDRLAHAEHQRRELLRAHELARELHDSVGHALTAIGVQAEAGARVAGADPGFAREALEQISVTTRAAVAELDEVLGTLRTGAESRHATRSAGVESSSAGVDSRHATRSAGVESRHALQALLAPFGPAGSGTVRTDLDGEVAEQAGHTAYRVVQEAVSNARRHGSADPSGHVRLRDGWIEVLLENPVPADAPTTHSGGRGLVGMRERLALVGGSLDAGPARVDGQDGWRLVARIPAREVS